MRIGRGRVSTRDQHPEAQHDALTAGGCEEIFLDKASGKLVARPELSEALLVADRLVIGATSQCENTATYRCESQPVTPER